MKTHIFIGPLQGHTSSRSRCHPPRSRTRTQPAHTHFHAVPRRVQLSFGEWVTVGPNSEYNTHNNEIRGPRAQTSSAAHAATSYTTVIVPLYDDRLKKIKN